MSEPSKNNINDTLLSNVQSGDSKNTEALISEYRSVVEAIASKYTNSPLEYEDIIQELQSKLLTKARAQSLKPMHKPA